MISISRDALVQVLIYHQHTKTSACICGWNVLGASHPEHVADIVEMVAAENPCQPGAG